MSSSKQLPKVSVIMPTYNRAAYILESIDSVRNQTYNNWELIIVDDGSDDNTEEIVKGLNDSRVQFYKAGRIGINGKIKNIGLGKATGELIAFIDSDDLWAAEKIGRQVELLQQYPEAGFCLTGGYNFREPGKPIDFFYKQKQGVKVDSVFIPLFQSQIAAYAQVLMLWKKCIDVTGAFREVKSFSDVDFIINLASHFKAVIIYDALVFRRLHDDNYITDNWIKSYHEGIEIIEFYRKENQISRAIARDALYRLYINFGVKYLSYKEKTRAISCFFRAWLNKPFSIVPLKKTGRAILVE